jgi:hypothetical protein
MKHMVNLSINSDAELRTKRNNKLIKEIQDKRQKKAK